MSLLFAISGTFYSCVWTNAIGRVIIAGFNDERLTSGQFDILGNSDAIVR